MEIIVNLDNLTIGDWSTVKKLGGAEVSDEETLDLLDKVVEGDIRELPLTALFEILTQLNEQLTLASNPEADGKN